MNAQTTSFVDSGEILSGVEYCYEIRALYPSGQTYPTNTACALYYLAPPVGVNAEGNDDERYITVSWDAPGSSVNFEVEIITDIYPTETSWELLDQDGNYVAGIASGTLTEAEVLYEWSQDIPPGSYTFNIYDTWGDGIYCTYGYFQLLINDAVFAGGPNVGCDFGTGASVEFDTNGFVLSHTEYQPVDHVEEDRLNGSPYNGEIEIIESNYTQLSRDMLAYRVYRNGEFLAETDINTFSYIDNDTEHDVIYCYTVKAVYGNLEWEDDGESVNSNESCAQWILRPPTDFYALGVNGQIELSWLAPDSDAVLGYTVYRDGVELASTTTTFYNDVTAVHNTEYCYTITADYDIDSSLPTVQSCAMWEILPPYGLLAEGTDGCVNLSWSEPTSLSCADEVVYALPFNAIGSNVGMEDNWLVQGSQGADYAYKLSIYNTTVLDVTLCSANTTYDPKLEIFTADQDCNETTTGYYNDDNTCEFSSLHSSLLGTVLEPGDYYIVVDGFGGGEGQYEINITESGLHMEQQPSDIVDNVQYESQKTGNHINIDDWNVADNVFELEATRELLAFNIYKEGNYLTQVEANVFEYDDCTVSNLTEYCYTVTGLYEVGESEPSNIACAVPIPGEAPSDLYAYGESGLINLEWAPGSQGVLNYSIYRDGNFYATSESSNFTDNSAQNNIEYCYTVTANYPSGESQSTNESCAMWVLAAPLSITATGGNGFIEVEWTEPGVVTCSDEVIPSLPFNAIGSNVGMGDDWLVQGSQGADYSYYLNVTNPVIIDITLCSANTTYDTKLEIFTADADCNEATTGYYIDDATCEFSSLQSSLLGVSLEPGQYYIVVDGYGGGEGQYEINVTESGLQAMPSNDLLVNIALEEQKSGFNINQDEWNIADGDYSYIESRNLNSFNLYRDNTMIASIAPDVYSYIDQPLENGTTYCYYVVAEYDQGDSDPTPTICAAPDAGPMCPPENLILNIEDGDVDINLSWDFPDPACEGDDGGDGGGNGDGGGDGGQGDCVDGEVVDCSGDGDCCPETWIGDGFGDCEDQAFGCDLTCYDNDGGDCGGLFNDNHGETKEHLHADQTQSRIEGFNIYRDNDLIGWVSSDQNTYTDNTIDFGTEYCYKIKALYEQGESNPTETECGTVTDPGDFSIVTLESTTAQSGDQVTIDVDVSNQFPIGGFQFYILDTPNLLSTVECITTPRSEGFTLSWNEQADGSVIVVGFNLSGGTIDIGSGPIMNLTYQSSTVNSLSVVDLSLIHI